MNKKIKQQMAFLVFRLFSVLIVGILLSILFKLISVLRPEEVVLDAEDQDKAS